MLLLLIRHGENDYTMWREAQRKALGIEKREEVPDLSEEQIQEMKRKIK